MQAELKIDLANLAENYARLKRKGRKADCSAVVKANAYGLGAVPVAERLVSEGCDTFFVAHLEEGVELRQALPDVAIFVLGGLMKGEEATFITNGLSPVLNDPEQAERWIGAGTPTRAAIHLDTGMSRLGVQPEDFGLLNDLANRLDNPILMSHLCSAEDKADPLNALQLQLFHEATDGLAHMTRSFANSSGVFQSDGFHFDLLRPGVALYGANPEPGFANPMLPVVTLDAPLIQLRTLPSGAGVGYNATWTAARESLIGTLPFGYADGLFRTLSSNASLFFDGQAVPLVGRVSMDTVCVDLTDLARKPVAGDRLEILGGNQGVDDLAAGAGTIGYEILTSLGNRYKRVYAGS